MFTGWLQERLRARRTWSPASAPSSARLGPPRLHPAEVGSGEQGEHPAAPLRSAGVAAAAEPSRAAASSRGAGDLRKAGLGNPKRRDAVLGR